MQFQKRRAALPILKLLKSGVASAVHNFNLSPENLYVLNIFVDEGPMLKRFGPRAFGRAGAIHKKTSRITLILEERIMAGAKKRAKIIKEIKSEKEAVKEVSKSRRFGKVGAPTRSAEAPARRAEASEEIKPTRKTESFTRRIFRRKVIG